LDCLPATKSLPDHFATYARVDIALDPFPYHGTTTTCEAAFMGVPIVTLQGPMHHTRVGVSLLRTLGLSDLIATSEDEYVALAAALAGDAARLATTRAGLRQTLLASPLGDANAFATRFAGAMRELWREFCERR
jgi:predicted O-linked N-acetylglucosamine transferase (SPINDLY family)